MQNTPSALLTSALCIGMIAVLLLSVHLVGRALQTGFDSRWALSPSPLAALVVGLLVPRLIRPAALAQLFLLALVVLGMATQIGINQTYADDWQLRRELWQQIRWRAPQVKPNTMIVIYLPPKYLAFDRTITDYEVTGHSNLYYTGDVYPYVIGTDDRLVNILLAANLPREGIWSQVISGANLTFRNWEFDLDNMLLFGYDGSCLHTPSLQSQTLDALSLLAPFHNPTQILDVSLENAPPVNPTVQESPELSWCYYYQQIQWALQFNHDEQSANLADAAQVYAPTFSVEWLPLIEAYLRVGRESDAQALFYRVPITALCERFPDQAICTQ